MRKQSREALEAERKRLSHENTILLHGLNLIQNGKVHWYARKADEKYGTYHFGIAFMRYGAYLFIRFNSKTDGQEPNTVVHNLDEYMEGPWKLDRDGFTEWYKNFHEQVNQAMRLYHEHMDKEREVSRAL